MKYHLSVAFFILLIQYGSPNATRLYKNIGTGNKPTLEEMIYWLTHHQNNGSKSTKWTEQTLQDQGSMKKSRFARLTPQEQEIAMDRIREKYNSHLKRNKNIQEAQNKWNEDPEFDSLNSELQEQFDNMPKLQKKQILTSLSSQCQNGNFLTDCWDWLVGKVYSPSSSDFTFIKPKEEDLTGQDDQDFKVVPHKEKWTEILLDNHDNFNYIGHIHIGSDTKNTKPQLQRCVFDTGSTNTWVSTTMQDTKGDIKGKHELFDPLKSNTFRKSDYQCKIRFGSGTLSGVFGWDDVWLNYGSKENTIHIRQQEIGFVKKAEVFDDNFDCIVGLAYSKMAMEDTIPIVDNVIAKKVFDRNVFSFYMDMGPLDRKMGLKSKLVFGKIDKSDIIDEIVWFDVIDKDFWSLELTKIQLGDETLNLCTDDDSLIDPDDLENSPRRCLITPDSGTSCLTMPSWALDRVKDTKLPKDEPCKSDKEFPTIKFEMRDIDGIKRKFEIESEKYISIDDHKKDGEEKPQSTCSSIITPLDIKKPELENLFILGDLFMEKYKCFFDRDRDMVGIAMAKHHQDYN